MKHNVFDITWANYWINKYKKNHEPKKAKLVQQLVYIQETLGEKSILGTSILINGHYSYDELKSIIENDMDYHLDFPKNIKDHECQQKRIFKFLKDKKFNITFS